MSCLVSTFLKKVIERFLNSIGKDMQSVTSFLAVKTTHPLSVVIFSLHTLGIFLFMNSNKKVILFLMKITNLDTDYGTVEF